MSAHIVIEETKDGWTVRQDGLEGKHVDIELHGTGLDVEITDSSSPPPLQVSLGTPLEGN